MRILMISKYTGFKGRSMPTRQYFIGRALATQGCAVMLVGSRSNGSRAIPRFSGMSQRWREGAMDCMLLNGPVVTFGINMRRILSWIIFEFMLLLQIRVFRRFAPDVVLVSSLSFLTLATGVLLKRLLQCRLVVEIRDIYPLTLVEIGGFSRRNPIIRLLSLIEQQAYKSADLLVSPLEAFDRHASEVVGHRVPFAWIPMGFDDAAMNGTVGIEAAQVMERLRSFRREGKFLIGYAGTIGAANALDDVLKAARDDRLANCQFVFIGDGPLKPTYEKESSDRENVSFFGPVPRQDVPDVLSECDLLISPVKAVSLYRFGISANKWIEYSLSGRPFLTNAQEDLAVIKQGRNAFVSKSPGAPALADSIAEISHMAPQVLSEMGALGQAFVREKLRYSSLSSRLMKAIQSVGQS